MSDEFLVRLQAIVAAAIAVADDVDAVAAYAYADDEAFIAGERDLVDVFGE